MIPPERPARGRVSPPPAFHQEPTAVTIGELTFDLPLWVVVDEPRLWTTGLPGALLRMDDPSALGACLPVFTTAALAERQVKSTREPGLRPMPVGSSDLMRAILTGLGQIGKGVVHVGVDLTNQQGARWTLHTVEQFTARLPR